VGQQLSPTLEQHSLRVGVERTESGSLGPGVGPGDPWVIFPGPGGPGVVLVWDFNGGRLLRCAFDGEWGSLGGSVRPSVGL
jgi:hypothetical protein